MTVWPVLTVFALAVLAVAFGNLIAWGVQRSIKRKSRALHATRSLDDDLKGAAHV